MGSGVGLSLATTKSPPEQLQRVTLQAALQPVGKKTHRGQRGHGQRDGHHQQAQFTCAQVAQQVRQPRRAKARFMQEKRPSRPMKSTVGSHSLTPSTAGVNSALAAARRGTPLPVNAGAQGSAMAGVCGMASE
jgi:hypothetical protein